MYDKIFVHGKFYFKPGGVFKEDWCTVCQCINNAYICDDSSCQYKSTTETIELTTQKSDQTTLLEEFTTSYREIINNISSSVSHKYTSEKPISTTETKIMTTEFTSTAKWPETGTSSPYLIVSTTLPTEELSTVKNVKTTTGEIIFIPSTVTPPIVICDAHR